MDGPGIERQGESEAGPAGHDVWMSAGGASAVRAGRDASHRGTAWVVLAAGMGTRMKSGVPKVLHPFCGRPLGTFALEAASRWRPAQVVVVTGHKAEDVERELGGWARRLGVDVTFVRQQPQLGTGDAVRRALPVLLPRIEEVAVSYADIPLLSAATLQALCERRRQEGAALAILTARFPDPAGYGRVVRDPADPGRVLQIVEERDASPEERAIREINAGIYAFRRDALERGLAALRPDNAQGEYYLTDTVAALASAGDRVVAEEVGDPMEIAGVNDRRQLRELEHEVRERVRRSLMASGVTLSGEPAPVLDPWVTVGPDTVIAGGASLLGDTRIGRRCRIGPGSVLVNCRVEDDAKVEGVTLIGSRVGRGASIGPGAWIPSAAVIRAGARIGHLTGDGGKGTGG